MTSRRLFALVGSVLAALLLTAACAGAATRGDRHAHAGQHHHHRHAKAHRGRGAHRTRAERRRHRHRRAPLRVPAPAPATAAPADPTAALAPVAAQTPAPEPAAALTPASAPATSAPAASAASSGGCASADATPTAASVAAIRSSVLCLVNAQRAAHGLAALTDDAQLDAAAQGHSDDMVARRFFAHSTPEGADFQARIVASGYATPSAFTSIAENIAWGSGSQSTPAQIVSNWMSSPGHRDNILNGAVRDSGIGIAIGAPQAGVGGNAGTYTQDFGAR